MTSKRCFKCGQVKGLDRFYEHKHMADGHLNKCKDCTKAYEKERRQGESRAAILAYDRARAAAPHRVSARAAYAKTDAGRAAHNRATDSWSVKHPDRRKASHMVGNAIRDGLIHRSPCWVCGGKAQAHHPDYSRPLDVVWLCPPHHKAAHAIVRDFR